MNTINSNKNIHIHYLGLQQKEQMVFDRVINFNKTHGLNAQTCNEITAANVVITTESAYSQVSSIKNKAIVLVISKDTSLGDVQVASPLLITRVMKAIEKAIKLVDEKPEVATTEDKTQTIEAKAVGVKKPSVNPQTGHHALVIDDSISIRKHLELELRDSGISADFAESGEQALEKIKERQFDLIFLDIMMPGIDGYETCKQIRSNADFKKTPIIMLSGKTSPLDEVQGIIAGASTYLTKPVKSNKLQEVLGRVTMWIENFNAVEEKKEAATA